MVFLFVLAVLLTMVGGPKGYATITDEMYQESRIALVIGNNDYKKLRDKLDNPVNDASKMAKSLRSLGFKVIDRYNLDIVGIRRAVSKFKRSLTKNRKSLGLFFYSGHGMQFDGNNYIMPIGSMKHLTYQEDIPDYGYKVGNVFEAFKTAKNRANVILLDACRNTPDLPEMRPNKRKGGPTKTKGFVEENYHQNYQGEFIISYATEPGEVAYDNNYYTTALLALLENPGKQVEHIFKRVRAKVKNDTGDRQKPHMDNRLGEQDIYLNLSQRDRKKGSFNSISQPSGAEWYLDGNLMGTTPGKIDALDPGRYDILMKKNGYDNWSGHVYVSSGKEARITATLKEGPWTDPVTGMEFVWIPKGSFQMGQTAAEKQQIIEEMGEEKYKDYYSDENRHKVHVDGFWMAKHEVTVEQFGKFVQAEDYTTDAESDGGCWIINATTDWKWKKVEGSSWRSPGYAQESNHPVVCVSWKDTEAFVNWLGNQVRLPKEAEWEYAARATTKTIRYWGDNPHQACTYANVADEGNGWTSIHKCNDRHEFTAPVGEYTANLFGLHDMLGNVWEWTCSKYAASYDGSEKKCANIGDGSGRVDRGGSWSDDPAVVRSANRDVDHPGGRGSLLGFRIARTNP